MAVYRVDLITPNADPVLDWVETHVPKSRVARTVAFKVVDGWYFKCIFKNQEDAEAFHRRWYPGVDDHTVRPFGWRSPG
jgi:hypothetical protein